VSTGNFNEKTARHYTDHCLLTSSSSIMKDINHIFESLDSQERNKKSLKKLKTLIASPYNMRSQIYKMINKEIEYASKGKPSSIILKMNSLSDPLLIKKLFSASKKGVRVQLIIRGICCVPKDIGSTLYHPIPRSIVDQYLEHGRVWIFGAAGRNSIFISSADWMVRNLDHRIEVACPILDPKLKAEIYEIIFIQLNDNQKARILDYHLKNAYYHPPLSLAVRSQNEIFDFLSSKNKASYLKVTASD
jgi:polyphosphate kinase